MLNNAKKNNPFRVPENYFQDFTTEMMAQLPEKQRTKKVVPSWKSKSKWVAVAAALIGVAFIGINYIEGNDIGPVNNVQQEVSNSEQLASLQNDYYLFVEDEISESDYYDTFYSEQF